MTTRVPALIQLSDPRVAAQLVSTMARHIQDHYFGDSASHLIYTTKEDAGVCVSVCKNGPISARTLSFRHQTSRKFFHIATFPSPTFGPLFAFHCPLFFTKNNNLECRDVLKTLTVTTQDRPLNCKQQQWFSGTVLDSSSPNFFNTLLFAINNVYF